MFRSISSATAPLVVLLALLSVPADQQEVVANNRVDVALYYESLCPDSIRFAAFQLWPAWQTLAPYMNIQLIPFGKSSSTIYADGRVVFYCQHGPKECSGNKMQSCALSLLPTQDSQVKFVVCVMTKSDPSAAGEQCAAQVGLNYQDVEQCYQGRQGIELQMAAEQETNKIKIPLDFVPTVVYNGQFNQQEQDESQRNFKAELCRKIPQPPPECSS